MRILLVTKDDGGQFKITVPDGSSVTFGPFSPPSRKTNIYSAGGSYKGTLRIYEGAKTTTNIIACFSGIASFRDMEMGYAEQVAKEEGAVIWKDDKEGYVREDKVSRKNEWVEETPLLATSAPKRKRRV